MNRKQRISRETLLRQLGKIPEAYILEAADPASERPAAPARPERRGSDLWWGMRTSPVFGVCIGLIVALAAITAILRVGQSGQGGRNPAGTPTGSVQENVSGFTETVSHGQTTEEPDYILLVSSEPVILSLRRDGSTEIWEGTDADGASLKLVCNIAAQEYYCTRDGVYISNGKYLGRSTWDGGQTVFLMAENGICNADQAGFRAVQYVTLERFPEDASDSGIASVTQMRFFLPDIWRTGTAEIPPEYSPCLGRVVRGAGGTLLFVPESETALDTVGFYVLSGDFSGQDVTGLYSGDLVQVYWQVAEETYPLKLPVCRVDLVERGALWQVNPDAVAQIRSWSPDAIPDDGMRIGRIWRVMDSVYFIPEDETGQLNMADFCLLQSGTQEIVLSDGLRTGDRVRVPRGSLLYSEPPILRIKQWVLMACGTEEDIDPEIRRQAAQRVTLGGS